MRKRGKRGAAAVDWAKRVTGERMLVDGRYPVLIKEVLLRGSTTLAFPHALVVYEEDDYADVHAVPLSRLEPMGPRTSDTTKRPFSQPERYR